MHKSCRRGIRDIILAGQLIEILLSQNDTYDHRVGILTITGICHRFPSSTGNIERSYPGDMSTGFGQSCSWAMPMRSKIEGKKAESIFETKNWGTGRGAGAVRHLAGSLLTMGGKRKRFTVAVVGALLTPYSCWPYLPCFPPPGSCFA